MPVMVEVTLDFIQEREENSGPSLTCGQQNTEPSAGDYTGKDKEHRDAGRTYYGTNLH